ncbi:MAG: type I methionyl aminopeptidase [Bdellovibrio sp.]|nr:MAG: type I methionyl aminopeptidase [Bdellovibrio sp.]
MRGNVEPLTQDEIRKMKRACRLAAQTLEYVKAFVKPGVTTNEIDQIVHEHTLSLGARPAPLNYHGFPKSVCTSVNSCICHGVPDDRPLQEGDIVNIDVTHEVDGFYGDTSAMFLVGEVSERARKICEVAKEAMLKGIEAIRPYGTTGDIGFAINKYVTKKGFFPVKEIGGHGIGKRFHGDPFVPSYGKKGRGEKLRPWTCITVEPMINETGAPIRELPIEGSDVKVFETSDGSLSAQYEHTILITDTGYEILTVP